MRTHLFSGQRMKQIRMKRDIRQTDLAATLGITQGQVSRYENKGEQPAKELAEKIAAILNVSLDYLYGKTNNPVIHPLDRKLDVENLTKKDLEQLKQFQAVLEHLDRDRPLVPVYDRFVLIGEEFSEDYISGYRLNECGADYVIRANDMSMEPVIPEGALVYVKQESELKAVNGKLALFADTEGYPLVRKVVLKDDIVALLSYNKGWDTQLMRVEELEEVYMFLGGCTGCSWWGGVGG